MRILAGILVLAVAAVACNFIVESKFKDYGTTCQFEGRGTQCGSCIAQKCGRLVDTVCTPKTDAGGYSTMLSEVEQCALGYDLGGGTSNWACRDYFTDAGDPIAGNDPTAVLSQLRHCVETGCVGTGGATACRGCKIEYVEPNSRTAYALESNACGKCIRAACADLLVNCCSSDAVEKEVRPCGFWDRSKLDGCQKLFGLPDGGRPDSGFNDQCTYDVRECAKQCAPTCGL
jgi:hypothetical protein